MRVLVVVLTVVTAMIMLSPSPVVGTCSISRTPTTPSSSGVPNTLGFATAKLFASAFGDVIGGDGEDDLVVGTDDTGIISVYPYVAGNFPPISGAGKVDIYTPPPPPGPVYPVGAVAIGDMNDDSHNDVVVAWAPSPPFPSPALTVLYGDSTTSFTAVSIGVGGNTNPRYLKIGDVDKDGRLDVVMFGDNLGIFYQSPALGSWTATSLGPNDYFTYGDIGDINGDGNPDIARALYTAQRTDIYYGTAFTNVVSRNFLAGSGEGCRDAHLADVDGNGYDDLIICCRQCLVYLTLENGLSDTATYSLTNAVSLPLDYKYVINNADYNGDGRMDYMIAGNGDKMAIYWLPQDPIASETFSTLPATAVEFGYDLDSIHRAHVLGGTSVTTGPDRPPPIMYYTCRGHGGGACDMHDPANALLPTPLGYDLDSPVEVLSGLKSLIPNTIAFGPLTRVAGLITYVGASTDGGLYGFDKGLTGQGLPDVALPAWPAGSPVPSWLVLADVNGDAGLDIVLAAGTDVVVLPGSSAPQLVDSFTTATTVASAGSPLVSVATGSFTPGGSFLDIVAASSDALLVLQATATPLVYSESTIPLPGSNLVNALLADLDGNGRDDLAYLDEVTGNVYVSLTAPFDPTLTPHTTAATNVGDLPLPLRAGRSLSGSGALDLATASRMLSAFVIVPNTGGTGTFGSPVVSYASGAGHLTYFDVQDASHDGQGDLLYCAEFQCGAWASYRGAYPDDPNFRRTYYPTSSANASYLSFDFFSSDGYADCVLYEGNAGEGPSLMARPVDIGFGTRVLNAAPLSRSNNPFVRHGIATLADIGAIVARTSSCASSTLSIDLAGARITGCALPNGGGDPVTVDGVAVRVWSSVPGAVFDCGAGGGGGLFSVVNGGHLILEGVDIVGATYPRAAAGFTSPLFVGASSTLELKSLSVSSCSNVGAPELQPLAGLGGVVHVNDGTVRFTGVTASNNVAALSGGVVYMTGISGEVTLTDSVFSNNGARGTTLTAVGGGVLGVVGTSHVVKIARCQMYGSFSGGNGGAIQVSADGGTLNVEATVIAGSSAGGGGGAIAVVGNSGTTATLTDTVVSGSTGGIGGALAVSSASLVQVAPISSSRLPVVDEVGPAVSLANTTFADSGAEYGGTFLSCGGVFSVDSLSGMTGSSRAGIGGGCMFVCSKASFSTVDTLSSLCGSASTSADGYGTVMASPPVNATLVEGPSETLSTGGTFGVGLVMSDLYGSVVVDSTLRVDAWLSPAASTSHVVTTLVPREMEGTVLNGVVGVSVVTEASFGSVSVYIGVLGLENEASLTKTISLDLTACLPGFGLVTVEPALECGECQAGSSSPGTGLTPCELDPVCGPGAIVINGTCVSCPANTGRVGTNVTCVCLSGFWSPSGATEVACLACPVGALCAGEVAQPQSRTGYFQTGSSSFSACPIEESCTGSSQCAPGYAGYMCKDCASDYYRQSDQRCLLCPPASAALFILLIVLIIVCSIGAFVIAVLAIATASEEGGGRLDGRTRLIPHAVSVGLTFFQVLGILATAPLNWPEPPVQQVLETASVTNIRLSTFATACTLTSFQARYNLSMIIPALIAVVVLVLIGIFKVIPHLFCCLASRSGAARFPVIVDRLIFTLAPLLYIPLSHTALTAFDCSRLANNKLYLDAELSIECFSSEWMSMMPAAVVGGVVYVVAIPGYIALILWKNRRDLDSPAIFGRFGVIYQAFRRRFYYYEVVLLVKRLAIVSVALFVSNLQVWLLAGLIMIFLASTFHHLARRPYYNPLHNQLEARLNIITLLVILGGVVFWSHSSEGGTDWPNRVARYFVIVAVIVSIVIGCAIIVFATVRELGDRRRAKVAAGENAPYNKHDAYVVRWIDYVVDDIVHPVVRAHLVDASRAAGVGGGGGGEMGLESGGDLELTAAGTVLSSGPASSSLDPRSLSDDGYDSSGREMERRPSGRASARPMARPSGSRSTSRPSGSRAMSRPSGSRPSGSRAMSRPSGSRDQSSRSGPSRSRSRSGN